MCCEGKNAKDAYAPSGTWLDRTQQDTFTASDVAAAEGVSVKTVSRLIARGAFGPLVYWVSASPRVPRLAIVHFHAWSRSARRAN